MKFNYLIFSAALLPTFSFAFFCPTNFNQIQEGDSIEQVQALCGKPDKQETVEKKAEGPQEWSYFVPQTVGMSSMNPAQGTLKTQVTFDSSGKAINISVNGIGVGSTAICGSMIQLGDSSERIKSACGTPVLVNKQSPEENKEQPTKITSFTYGTTPPVTLMFENGKLMEKQ